MLLQYHDDTFYPLWLVSFSYATNLRAQSSLFSNRFTKKVLTFIIFNMAADEN